MPRTLPWNVEPKSKKPRTTSTPISTIKQRPQPASRLINPAESSSSDDLNSKETKSSTTKRTVLHRTHSSSPPPAPVAAPEIEFMIDGYGADDGWMMVEDEFAATAKLFTSHIHHAEYARLKKLARERGTDALRRSGKKKEGKKALRSDLVAKEEPVDAASESGEDFRMGPRLAGLMAGSQKQAVVTKDLSGLIPMKIHTRAAAGFEQSSRKDGMGDSRKLDEESREGKAKTRPWSDDIKDEEMDDDENEDDSDDLDLRPRESIRRSDNTKAPIGYHHTDEMEIRRTPRKEIRSFDDFAVRTPEVATPPTSSEGLPTVGINAKPEISEEPPPTNTLVVNHVNLNGKGSRAAALIAKRMEARKEQSKDLFDSDNVPNSRV